MRSRTFASDKDCSGCLRNQDISGLCANRFGSKFALHFEVELIHFDMGAGTPGTPFGNGEDNVEQDREGTAAMVATGLVNKLVTAMRKSVSGNQNEADRTCTPRK